MKAMLRRSLASLVGLLALSVAPAAFAEGEACYNDDDCPLPACGGDVCNWTKTAPKSDGMKIFYCQPAGKDPVGQDGWCTDDSDCKCKGEGATCQLGMGPTQNHCTKTVGAAGPLGMSGSSAGGSSSTAGAPSTAGMTSAGGTSSTAGTASKPAEEESGGCSVASPASTGGSIALALGLVGVGAAFARRRRAA